MPRLGADTVTVLDGDVRLYRRANSRAWQAAFKLDGRWVRVSTNCKQLSAARERARELFVEYRVRQKNGLPVISKRFADVAQVAVAEMQQQLAAGTGKSVYRDYITVLERYLIPYFGDRFVTSIAYEDLRQFALWREQKLGREPRASTLNTHNSALNRVFDAAVARGYMNRSHVPQLINKGRDSERRPDFRREEYRRMIARLPSWINAGREGKSREMRHLLRDYVLILANTGIRHGTEAANLKWRHIHLFEEGELTFLEMHVSGKTGPRDIICRSGTVNYLKRIQSRCPDIAGMTFEALLRAQLDLPVFRLGDGTVSLNLRQTFRILMRDTGLLTCPRTGQDRTLYSLRHTYATFALLNDGMDVHTLAVQMGTSIGMIERHYSHLTPRLRKEMLTGRRYELSEEEYRQRFDRRSHALAAEDLSRVVDGTAALVEDLPNDPIDSGTTDAVEVVAGMAVLEADAKPEQVATLSPAERAFDLFDRGAISESTLLAALGVSQSDYVISDTLAHRALTAVEQGRMTEAGLVRVMERYKTPYNTK